MRLESKIGIGSCTPPRVDEILWIQQLFVQNHEDKGFTESQQDHTASSSVVNSCIPFVQWVATQLLEDLSTFTEELQKLISSLWMLSMVHNRASKNMFKAMILM